MIGMNTVSIFLNICKVSAKKAIKADSCKISTDFFIIRR